MAKTAIEWLHNPTTGEAGFSVNPIKGRCPNPACPLGEACYARRLYDRFKWNPEIRFEPEKTVKALQQTKAGDKIFWGSTMELFGEWVKPEWLEWIFDCVKIFGDRIHIFLTKKPENLIKFSPFPRNTWVGATVTDGNSYRWAMAFLSQISARVKFISIEPLLTQFWLRDWEYQKPLNATLDWVILGQQTPPSKKTSPKIEWIVEIVKACDRAGIPVFEKNNLESIRGKNLRQEFPNV